MMYFLFSFLKFEILKCILKYFIINIVQVCYATVSSNGLVQVSSFVIILPLIALFSFRPTFMLKIRFTGLRRHI